MLSLEEPQPHVAAGGFTPRAAGVRLSPAPVIMSLFSGHDFLLDSVVNNVINNITVELPSFTSDTTTITTTSLPKTTTEDYDEPISNEIQVISRIPIFEQRRQI